jgi:hypothetical protein
MRMTHLHYSFHMMMAALALFLIPAFSGCKSTPPAPNASTQNAATPAGTASGTNAGNATAAGSSSSAASASGAAASNPAPEPPKPVSVTLTVAAGKDVHVRINETINSKTANVGDPFSGELSSALTTKSGETVFAKGVRVSGTVVAAKGQGRFKGAGILAIELKTVGGRPVTATEYVVTKKGKGKRSAALIGGGAGGGALIGGLAGGGKGALLGGLIGSGAGTAGAAFTGNKPLVIPTESIVVFELTQPLSITVQK